MSISADEKKLNALIDTFTKTYTDIVEHLKSVLQKRLEFEFDFLGEGAVPMHYVDDDGNEENVSLSAMKYDKECDCIRIFDDNREEWIAHWEMPLSAFIELLQYIQW